MQLPIRFIRCTFLAGLLAVSGVGCSRPADQGSISLLENSSSQVAPAKSDDTEHPTVALVMKTLTNPFFVEMEKGARQAESELEIHLIVETAAQETSIEQQIGIVENLIQRRVQAIVIAPGDSVELVPVLKKAQDAGITVINIDNRLDQQSISQLGLKPIPFISVDNNQAAYLSAKVISDRIHTPSHAAILEGIRTAKNAEDRKQGALRAFHENPNIKSVLMETANWKIDEAAQVTQSLLEKQPDINAIFCANDMMALGAIEYLKTQHRSDVLVAGYDALEDAKAAIQKGSLTVTIDQQAKQQGYLGTKYAVQALKGEPVPPETLVEVKVITAKDLSSH